MRVGFCGHPYHRTTGSSRFILEALRTLGSVEEHWPEDEVLELEPLLDGGYDAVVVWQTESAALRLAQAGLSNVTFFPMYDSCHAYPDSYWRRLSGAKVVSFSSTLHARLQRLGVRVRFARYYPEIPAERADDGPDLAGYFWLRHQDVSWATIAALVRQAPFRRFTLHDAPDPSPGQLARPGAEDAARLKLRRTAWFPARAQAQADLLAHNVYFAPRLREGIGMSFLEAMALGFLVVAPDRPTMNEYVVSGVNGLLYDPAAPAPLEFAEHRRMGRRAREGVAAGRERWCRSLPALLDLVATPTREVPVLAPLGALDPLCWWAGQSSRAARRRPSLRSPAPSRPAPRVTVVVPGPAAGPSARSATLESVLAQDWPLLETLVLETAPEPGAEPTRPREGLVRVRVAPGAGGALALDEAVATATGQFLLFLAAGDELPARDAISCALRDAPPDVDVVVGDHLRRGDQGQEEECRGVELALALPSIRRGEVDWRWLEVFPVPSAVLWRATLLRRVRLRAALAPLVHEDALLRAVQAGARVHHALGALARTPGRWRTARERGRILDAWQKILAAQADAPEALDRRFAVLRAEVARHDLHRLSRADLVRSLLRVPGALRELKRRVRARRAIARAGAGAGAPPVAD
jgi:hypothetical protein